VVSQYHSGDSRCSALTGYRWDSFPKGAYDTHLRFGVGALNEIVEQLNQSEKELSNSGSG
jgi:hypothetical protein